MKFLLPREILVMITKKSNKEVLYSRQRLGPKTASHLEYAQTQSAETLLAVGLWGDGVPCNWDRSDSLEMFVLNIPGLPAPWHNLRVPCCGLSKKHVNSKNTYDDILAVLAWSFTHLATGRAPGCRHDGSAFNADDCTARKKQAGQPLGVAAALC